MRDTARINTEPLSPGAHTQVEEETEGALTTIQHRLPPHSSGCQHQEHCTASQPWEVDTNIFLLKRRHSGPETFSRPSHMKGGQHLCLTIRSVPLATTHIVSTVICDNRGRNTLQVLGKSPEPQFIHL